MLRHASWLVLMIDGQEHVQTSYLLKKAVTAVGSGAQGGDDLREEYIAAVQEVKEWHDGNGSMSRYWRLGHEEGVPLPDDLLWAVRGEAKDPHA